MSARVHVRAKDEGNFIAVTIVDDERFAAWRKANGISDAAPGIPFGSNPDGIAEYTVASTAEAEVLASEHDTTVEWV